MLNHRSLLLACFSVVSIGIVSGCQDPASAPGATTNSGSGEQGNDHGHEHADGEGEHGHSHGAGPHGGTLADWGGGKYHVEFSVDHDKQEATIYVLGDDEKTAIPIQATNVALAINEPEMQIELLPVPLEGEADGLSSRFVGKHEKLGTVQEFAGTISAEINGTPFTGDFKEEAHDAHDHK